MHKLLDGAHVVHTMSRGRTSRWPLGDGAGGVSERSEGLAERAGFLVEREMREDGEAVRWPDGQRHLAREAWGVRGAG